MIFKRALPLLIAAFVASFLASPALAKGSSQPSCPGDIVVWENSSTHVYHLSGDKYFGNTKHGAYACKADADKGGFRAAKSGGKSSGSSASPAAGKHHHHHKGAAAGASAAPSPAAT